MHTGANLLSRKSQTAAGLALCLALAALSLACTQSPWLEAHGLGTLTIAIVLGMLVGNTLYARVAASCAQGVDFSKQRLLRLGVILYGFHLTFTDIAQVGIAGVVIDALVISTTFALAWLAGGRLFGIDRSTSILIGVGSSICGAAAVMAAEPVVRGRAEQVTVAVSTVLVFGTLATLLYPALYHLNQQWGWIPPTAQAFGIYTGSTVHEVAQVVAAAHSVSAATADTAVIAKMVRVMLLAPFLILLSAYLSRSGQAQGDAVRGRARIAVPWFAIGFTGVALVHSMLPFPAALVRVLLGVDTLLLAMAMAALGLTTHASALRRAGFRPLMFAALLFAWLVLGGALINHIVMGAMA